MSDEALLIGKTVAEAEQSEAALRGTGRSGLAVPSELVPTSLFGQFEDETGSVEQKETVRVPHGAPDTDIAKFIWQRTAQQGVLTAIGEKGEINLYPLSLFKRFVFQKHTIVGVTL